MDRALLRWSAPLRGPLRMSSFAMIAGSLGPWVRAKTVDQHQRANAERRAIFVGLWPSMLWLLSDALPDRRGRRR